VRQALERDGPLELAPLEAAWRRPRDAARRTPDDEPASPELIAADLDFHREMVQLADSPRLSRAHETLAAEAQMLLQHQPHYPPSDYAADHSLLLDAIARRSPAAPRLVRDHLRLSARLIASELGRTAGSRDSADDGNER
jgi:DNA-binding GntR family transcriptional regulator